MLLDVRASNVAVVAATVSRGVLPLVNDQALAASAVMEEECGHSARRGIAAGTEMSIDEGGRITTSVRHTNPIAMRIKRSLHFTCGKWDDEVAVEAPCHATSHCASGGTVLAGTGTKAR